ncbi:MAG TPA: putative metal-binding motif-containing protein, partial [Myxococcota bacterium]|nr:putative metal-binding motif-containing protein [Myxococcota bacterium]
MRLLGIGALLWTFGCNGESVDSEKPVTDQDRDGFAAEEDCNDADRKVNPSAEELCNEVDDNCDGTVDNDPVDEQIFYADTDADGFGNPSATGLGCTAPTGFVEDRTDCDDARADIHP